VLPEAIFSVFANPGSGLVDPPCGLHSGDRSPQPLTRIRGMQARVSGSAHEPPREGGIARKELGLQCQLRYPETHRAARMLYRSCREDRGSRARIAPAYGVQ